MCVQVLSLAHSLMCCTAPTIISHKQLVEKLTKRGLPKFAWEVTKSLALCVNCNKVDQTLRSKAAASFGCTATLPRAIPLAEPAVSSNSAKGSAGNAATTRRKEFVKKLLLLVFETFEDANIGTLSDTRSCHRNEYLLTLRDTLRDPACLPVSLQLYRSYHPVHAISTGISHAVNQQ